MSLWERVFAAGYDRFMAGTEKAGLRDMRRELLAAARGRTLELGAGTGANVELYPAAVTELVLAEPAEPMAVRLEAKHPQATVVPAPAEALPFEDDSLDTVVSTLVLCPVRDPERTLAEVPPPRATPTHGKSGKRRATWRIDPFRGRMSRGVESAGAGAAIA